MYEKDFILLSINKRDGRPHNTSGVSIQACCMVARRQVRNNIARPVAVVNRKGDIVFSQAQLDNFVAAN